MKYSSLSLTTLDQAGQVRTCNYWYLVQNGVTAHTAFTNREALLLWLKLRGLELTEDLPQHGESSYQPIKGEYCTESHMWAHEFNALPSLYESKGLSNGDYTMLRFTIADGVVTEHHLNPNCKDRPIYNYKDCRPLFG